MKQYRIVWKGKITECAGQGEWSSEERVTEKEMLNLVKIAHQQYSFLDHKLEIKKRRLENVK